MMDNLFPDNSYMGGCSCGAEFIGPKGTLHCHNCLYKSNAKLKKELVELRKANAEIEKERGIRDLEQQVKGLRDYSEHLTEDAKGIPIGLKNKVRGSNIYNWQTHFARELRYRSNNLSVAVEALKTGN